MAHFSEIQHGCLPAGTETPYGVIEAVTFTAYKMADGTFVPFAKIHGAYAVAEPLVVLR